MRRVLILILLFYFLAIFQESFVSHFTLFGASLNLILISVFLLIFFEESWSFGNLGILSGFLGGTILDFFSSIPFGIFALNLTLSAFLTKKISKNFKKSNILTFFVLFLFYFCFYKIFLVFENLVLNFLFKKEFLFFSFNLTAILAEIFLSLSLIFLILLLTPLENNPFFFKNWVKK